MVTILVVIIGYHAQSLWISQHKLKFIISSFRPKPMPPTAAIWHTLEPPYHQPHSQTSSGGLGTRLLFLVRACIPDYSLNVRGH